MQIVLYEYIEKYSYMYIKLLKRNITCKWCVQNNMKYGQLQLPKTIV